MPNYNQYNNMSGYLYSEVPYQAWSKFESLIDTAAGDGRELMNRVISVLAKISKSGYIEHGYAAQFIPDVVRKVRKQTEEGKYHVFMDCLAALHDEGELPVDDLNEFLIDNNIGYRAATTIGGKVRWYKRDELEERRTPDNCSKSSSENSNKETLIKKTRVEKANNKAMREEIFISHRQKDAPVADIIKDFLVGTGIPNNKVFCSSLPGNDVNERISPEVRRHLSINAILNVSQLNIQR